MRQCRLDEGLKGQREGPEVQRCAQPAPACEQRQRCDEAVEVADVQRQAGGGIELVAVPPNIVSDPVDDRENAEPRRNAASCGAANARAVTTSPATRSAQTDTAAKCKPL
jgi:hypothetical protein